MKKKIACQLLIFLLLGSTIAYAQKILVRGVVTNRSSGDSLPNVSVIANDGSASTMTDASGAFALDVNKGVVLIFSHASMESLNYVIKDEKLLNIELVPKIEDLDKVVVIGYGSLRKKDVTSAISTVSVKGRYFQSGLWHSKL